jgi:short-subunit dehydrogenase
MSLKVKYGQTALVAGASEGIGAAFAEHLASMHIDLVLIARRQGPLESFARKLKEKYTIQVTCISLDLSTPDAPVQLMELLQEFTIDILVYNAGLSYIDHFEDKEFEAHRVIMQTNMITPLHVIHQLAPGMLERGRGAIILMASLAGFQGTPFIATYSATKAFDQILGESLWYEWKDRGVDVLVCCAGATATPNFISTNPGKQSFFAPKVQQPEDVVAETFIHLGKRPSFISGRANKIASFFMQRVLSRKKAVTIMGDTTKKMYRQ